MTQSEIKEKIDANNLTIETLMTPNNFMLNTMVADLLKENRQLQKQCQHEFVNGQCIYCYKNEG